jgi:hypothetical protein
MVGYSNDANLAAGLILFSALPCSCSSFPSDGTPGARQNDSGLRPIAFSAAIMQVANMRVLWQSK